MERLTTRNIAGVAVYKNPFECERCGETIWRLPDYGNGSPTEKLAAYEDAEEQGLLLRLPCKLGDIAYEITGATTRGYDWKYLTYEKAYIHGTVFNLSRLHDIGKTIFLTKEEAEEKLKELKEMEGAE